jgi:hypothetical protein
MRLVFAGGNTPPVFPAASATVVRPFIAGLVTSCQAAIPGPPPCGPVFRSSLPRQLRRLCIPLRPTLNSRALPRFSTYPAIPAAPRQLFPRLVRLIAYYSFAIHIAYFHYQTPCHSKRGYR